MSTKTVTRKVCDWCGKKSRPLKHFTQNDGQHDYPKGWTWAHLVPNSPWLMDWCSDGCKDQWLAMFTTGVNGRGRVSGMTDAFYEKYGTRPNII